MGTAILMEMQIGLPMMKTVGDVRTARKIARSASGCPLPELFFGQEIRLESTSCIVCEDGQVRRL